MPSSVDRSKPVSPVSSSEDGSLGMLPGFKWALVLDALPEGVSVHSMSGEILWVNKALCDIYSKSFSSLNGLSCQQVFHVEGSPCPHEQVLATGRGVQARDEVHIGGRTLAAAFEPILDDNNQVCGFIRIVRAVTDGLRMDALWLNAERFATLGQILAGIAHDVGTPLNIISGYSEFLLMRAKPEDSGYKELSTILQQTRRIAALFGEALDLARLPQGRSDAIELKSLFEDVLNLAGHYLRKEDVKAVLTCRIDAALIYGEASQLKQAFLNLILNAGQQVGTGGKLEIVIDEMADRPGFLALTYYGTEKTGVGHDFSQSLASFVGADSETGGVGLGLSLAKKILNEAGAEITSSTLGARGAQLTVYLPLNAGSNKA